jgi:hypothetical protein
MCREAFSGVVERLDGDSEEGVCFGSIWDAWRAYYFGVFARYDGLLRGYVDGGGAQFQDFLPLSISHHNLHRLLEVLRAELGDAPLTSAPVPERIRDLLEVCSRLQHLLAHTAPVGLAEGPPAEAGPPVRSTSRVKRRSDDV